MIHVLTLVCAFLAAPNPEAFFKEFAEKRQGIETLQAKFVQVSILPEERLSTSGSLLYSKPRRILYRTEDPARSTLVDGRYGYEYEPGIKQLAMYDLEQYPQVDAFFLGFDEDLDTLRKVYQLDVFTIKGGDESGKRGIRFKPKPGEEDDAYFREIAIYLRDKDLLPYRIKIDNEEDSQTIIEIDQSSYVINGKVDAKDTQIFAAEGTDVVLNDEVIRTVGQGGEYLPDPAPNASGTDASSNAMAAPEVAGSESPMDGATVQIQELPPPSAPAEAK